MDRGNHNMRERVTLAFSRRHVLKIVGGLFVFIPAIQHLIQPPTALAFKICEIQDCSYYLGRLCADPNNTGKRTYWDAWQCVDARTGDFCKYLRKDTGIPC